MLLSASEGRHWRYEVLEHADGYLVQMRDLESGEVDEEFATVFRTMPVAFAYAQMSAALDRHAAAAMERSEDEESALELEASERNFIALSERLGDVGISGAALRTWNRTRDLKPRLTVH